MAGRLEGMVVFPPDEENEPGPREIERALRSADLLPATLLPVTRLVTGQDGSIWLRREDVPEGDSVLWNVLDREGRPSGALYLPADQRIVATAGDILVAVELDEFDVPYLLRYRLDREG